MVQKKTLFLTYQQFGKAEKYRKQHTVYRFESALYNGYNMELGWPIIWLNLETIVGCLRTALSGQADLRITWIIKDLFSATLSLLSTLAVSEFKSLYFT